MTDAIIVSGVTPRTFPARASKRVPSSAGFTDPPLFRLLAAPFQIAAGILVALARLAPHPARRRGRLRRLSKCAGDDCGMASPAARRRSLSRMPLSGRANRSGDEPCARRRERVSHSRVLRPRDALKVILTGNPLRPEVTDRRSHSLCRAGPIGGALRSRLRRQPGRASLEPHRASGDRDAAPEPQDPPRDRAAMPARGPRRSARDLCQQRSARRACGFSPIFPSAWRAPISSSRAGAREPWPNSWR